MPPSPLPSPPPFSPFTSKAALKAAVKEFLIDSETAKEKHGNIADWNVSGIPNMSYLFSQEDPSYDDDAKFKDFDANITNWDTSSVTNMLGMFWVRSVTRGPHSLQLLTPR